MAHAPMFIRELSLPARTGIYVLLGLALMFMDARFDTMALLRAGIAWAVHPIQVVLGKPFDILGDAATFFVVHGELLQDNRRLLAERRQLQVRLQAYHTLEAENGHLRSLLALPARPGFAPQAVEIIRTEPNPFARKLTISRGARAGVVAGSPVIDATGLVGQVTRVYASSSEITLITSREQSAPVQNQRNGLRLIVSGIGSDNQLEVRYLDVHADLKPNDLLVTSGIDGVYPPGVPVCWVHHIEPPRRTPFASAVCAPVGGIGRHRQLYLLNRSPSQP